VCPASIATATIDLSSGSALFMGRFEGLSLDPSWNNLSVAGALRFVVTEETLLTGWIVAKGMFGYSSDVELVIVRDDCAQIVARSAAGSGKDVLPERYVAPGTYYAVVTGDYGAISYLASLTTRPAAPELGKSCSAPLPLTWNATTGEVLVHGDATGLHEWTRDACQDTNSEEYPQLVYQLDLPTRSYVNLSGVSLNIATGCWAQFACYSTGIDYGSLGGKPPLDAGTYYVVAKTQPPGTAFDITGTIHPWPTNETCQAASPIDLSSGTASIWGDTRYISAGTPVACTSSSTVGSQLVYAISTEDLGDQSLDVNLGVVYQAGSNQLGHSIVLQRACESTAASDVVACDPRSWPYTTSHLAVDILPPGQYWLSVGDEAGPFTMTVKRGPPRYPVQSNDTCASPRTVDLAALGSHTTVVSGDTRAADDSISGACGGADPGVGKDVVCEVVTGTRGRLDLQLTPAAGLDGVLRLGSSCAAPPDACANAAGANGAEALGVKLQGSPTFVWIDGAAGTAGPFTLQATYTPAPYNDVCVNAPYDAPLAPGTPRTGDLRDAYPDAIAACAAGEADLWYAYTNSGNSPQNVTFTVQPNGFDAVVRVVSDANGCATATCPIPVDSPGIGVAEATSPVSVKGGGTVLVQVTSNGAGGPFSIVAQAQNWTHQLMVTSVLDAIAASP
jgi:hypothetical protein